MSYLDRIDACRAWRPERYRPFVIGDEPLGRVTRDFARRLADFPRVFQDSAMASLTRVIFSASLGPYSPWQE